MHGSNGNQIIFVCSYAVWLLQTRIYSCTLKYRECNIIANEIDFEHEVKPVKNKNTFFVQIPAFVCQWGINIKIL